MPLWSLGCRVGCIMTAMSACFSSGFTGGAKTWHRTEAFMARREDELPVSTSQVTACNCFKLSYMYWGTASRFCFAPRLDRALLCSL